MVVEKLEAEIDSNFVVVEVNEIDYPYDQVAGIAMDDRGKSLISC